jgi:hypothetical protein
VTELQKIQKVVGETLIPGVRAQRKMETPQDETLPTALELFYTAFSIKRTYQTGAVFMARRYCELSGLDADHVEAFAVQELSIALLNQAEKDT